MKGKARAEERVQEKEAKEEEADGALDVQGHVRDDLPMRKGVSDKLVRSHLCTPNLAPTPQAAQPNLLHGEMPEAETMSFFLSSTRSSRQRRDNEFSAETCASCQSSQSPSRHQLPLSVEVFAAPRDP